MDDDSDLKDWFDQLPKTYCHDCGDQLKSGLTASAFHLCMECFSKRMKEWSDGD